MNKTNPTSEFDRQRIDIPEELFAQGLQLSPFRVYFRLRYMARGSAFVHVSQSSLAKRLRLDEETIRRSIRQLEDAGCITTAPSVNPFSKRPMNQYTFSTPTLFRKAD